MKKGQRYEIEVQTLKEACIPFVNNLLSRERESEGEREREIKIYKDIKCQMYKI